MYATFFYPGFLCQLSPTASFVCKNKQTNKNKVCYSRQRMHVRHTKGMTCIKLISKKSNFLAPCKQKIQIIAKCELNEMPLKNTLFL